MPLLLLIAFMLFAAVSMGDGIPVENGRIRAEHTVIDLSESQAEEVGVLGTLTLTSEQWELLKKISPYCPKRFDTILPIDNNDCTCGDYEYLILVSRQKAALLHGLLPSDATKDLESVFTTKRPETIGDRWDQHHDPDIRLRVDGRGSYYMGGSKIPHELLRHLLSLQQVTMDRGQMQPTKNDRTVTFTLSPGRRASAETLERLTELKEIATRSGWRVELNLGLFWESYDPQASDKPGFADRGNTQ